MDIESSPAPESDPTVLEWERLAQETKNSQKEYQEELIHEEELNPSRSPMHKFFNFVRFIVIIAAINMLVGQILSLTIQKQGTIEYALRCYVILLCSLIILTELEWIQFVLRNTILTNWITRGMFYAFIGVLGMEEFEINQNNITSLPKKMYIEVVSLGMIGCGILYTVMGLCCFQLIYKRAKEDYARRCELARTRESQARNSVVT